MKKKEEPTEQSMPLTSYGGSQSFFCVDMGKETSTSRKKPEGSWNQTQIVGAILRWEVRSGLTLAVEMRKENHRAEEKGKPLKSLAVEMRKENHCAEEKGKPLK